MPRRKSASRARRVQLSKPPSGRRAEDHAQTFAHERGVDETAILAPTHYEAAIVDVGGLAVLPRRRTQR